MHLQNNGFFGGLDSIFCDNSHPFKNLTADCLGPTPEIICNCCTLCCSIDGLVCVPLTLAPVTMPTLPPALGESRFEQLVGILAPAVSSTTTFVDTSSPQYKAAWWLATTDGLNLDFSLEVFDRVAQRYVMALLYHALDGENWLTKSGYVSDFPTCQWLGTSCDAEGLVTAIDLGSNAMVGSIPFEIGFFPNMQELLLDANGLTGNIPPSIFQMSQMLHLSVANNDLVGQIPTEIGQLGLCQRIDLCK
jgi:hypothetical protein